MGKLGIIVGIGMFVGGASIMFLEPFWEWTGSMLLMATGLWVAWFSKTRPDLWGQVVPALKVAKYRTLYSIILIVIAISNLAIWLVTGTTWPNTHLLFAAIGIGIGAAALIWESRRQRSAAI